MQSGWSGQKPNRYVRHRPVYFGDKEGANRRKQVPDRRAGRSLRLTSTKAERTARYLSTLSSALNTRNNWLQLLERVQDKLKVNVVEFPDKGVVDHW